MHGKKILLLAAFLLLQPLNAAAFDCVAFLNQGGLGDMSLHEAMLNLPPEQSVPIGDDLVDLDESNSAKRRGVLVSGTAKLADREAADTPILECRLLRVGFVRPGATGADLTLSVDGHENAVDVLLFQFRLLPQRAFPWRTNIPLLVKNQDRNAAALRLEQAAFFKLNERVSGRPGHLVVLPALNDNVRNLLPSGVWPGKDGAARTALALCEPVDCAKIKEWALAGAIEQGETSEADHAANPNDRSSTSDDKDGSTESPRTSSASTGGVAANPDKSRETPLVAEEVKAPVIIDTRDGGNALLDAEAYGGLACLLEGISPGLFSPAPRCSEEILASLGGRTLQLGVRENDVWELSFLAPLRPDVLRIVLPLGQDGVECIMHASYAAETGSYERVPLSPPTEVAGVDTPSVFQAELRNPPKIEPDGNVAVRLVATKPEDCGVTDRSFDLQVPSETLSVDLPADRTPVIQMLNVLMFNDIGHNGGIPERVVLADAMTDAVASAFAKVNFYRSEEVWPLVRARVGAMSPSGAALLKSVDGTELRRRGAEQFKEIGRNAVENLLANGLVTPDQSTITSALRQLAASGRAGNGAPPEAIDKVVAVLIGPAKVPSIRGEPVDPCASGVYQAVYQEFPSDMRPSLELMVFPIVYVDRMDQVLDAGQSQSGDVFSGRCGDPVAGIQIRPVVVENWQSPEDISRRFNVALSDQLHGVIENIFAAHAR